MLSVFFSCEIYGLLELIYMKGDLSLVTINVLSVTSLKLWYVAPVFEYLT